jgi:hypothetical protein
MPYEIIPNKKKVQKKFDYRVDKNMHHSLPKGIVDTQRKFPKVYSKKEDTL